MESQKANNAIGRALEINERHGRSMSTTAKPVNKSMRTIAQASEQAMGTIAKGLKSQRAPLRNKEAMEAIARPRPLQQSQKNKATHSSAITKSFTTIAKKTLRYVGEIRCETIEESMQTIAKRLLNERKSLRKHRKPIQKQCENMETQRTLM